MITNFNEKLFQDTRDANIAIFIENLACWIKFNASKENLNCRNYHEDRFWSYSSLPDFVNYFGSWTKRQIRVIIANCLKHGLIIIQTFNKKKYDNTHWYTLTDKALEYYPVLAGIFSYTRVNSDTTHVKSDTPIPEDLNNIRSNTNTISKSKQSSVETPITSKPSKKPRSVELKELIEVYREVFPNNPQPHPRVISTTLQRVLNEFIRRWPEIDPEHLPLNSESFREYLLALKEFAPKFSLSEYTTQHGNRKKNRLETFCRYDIVVKFLEGQYS